MPRLRIEVPESEKKRKKSKKQNTPTVSESSSGTSNMVDEIVFQTAAEKLSKFIISGINEFNIPSLFKNGKISPEACEFTMEQIYKVIERAQEIVKVVLKRDTEFQKSLIIAQYEENYALARTDKDYKACADILSKKSKLLGLESSSQKEEISAKGAIEIIHTYNTLSDRTDATIDLKQFEEGSSHPYPDG